MYQYIVALCVIQVYEHPIRFVFGLFPLFLDRLPMTRFSKLTEKDIPSPLAAVGNIILKSLWRWEDYGPTEHLTYHGDHCFHPTVHFTISWACVNHRPYFKNPMTSRPNSRMCTYECDLFSLFLCLSYTLDPLTLAYRFIKVATHPFCHPY